MSFSYDERKYRNNSKNKSKMLHKKRDISQLTEWARKTKQNDRHTISSTYKDDNKKSMRKEATN